MNDVSSHPDRKPRLRQTLASFRSSFRTCIEGGPEREGPWSRGLAICTCVAVRTRPRAHLDHYYYYYYCLLFIIIIIIVIIIISIVIHIIVINTIVCDQPLCVLVDPRAHERGIPFYLQDEWVHLAFVRLAHHSIPRASFRLNSTRHAWCVHTADEMLGAGGCVVGCHYLWQCVSQCHYDS